jgi:hypothetical protein
MFAGSCTQAARGRDGNLEEHVRGDGYVAREAMKRTPPGEPKARESGAGPVHRGPAISNPPPPPPQASRFEPLPLGSNAFAPPVFTTTTEDEPSRWRKAMPWLIVAGIAGASGLAVWIAMLLNQPASNDAAEEQPVAAESAAEPAGGAEEQPAQPAAEAKTPAGKIEPAQPAQPAADPDAVAALPNPPAAAPAAEASAADGDEDEPSGRTQAERDAAREKRRAARAAKAAAASASSGKLPAAPSRNDVIAAMAGVHAAVVRCMDGAHGVVTADMKILGTGRVASANVSGAPPKAGSCIAGAVRKAKFPAFSATSIAVRYPMKL